MRVRYCLFFAALMAPAADLHQDLVFRATFNKSLNAEKSSGDPQLYSAPNYQTAAKAGLAGTQVVQENGALHYTKKNTQAVFFKADHISSQQGTLSFFLQLDPNLDLEPGYVDPLQLTDKAYNDSALWVDFTKDDQPRHFRLGVFGDLKSWNPQNLPPDTNPNFNQRLVIVKQPPFARGKWTHVAIAYSKLGNGAGQAQLYLDGHLQGATSPIKEPFAWAAGQATLRLGVNYTGWMDEIAIYRRPLTAAEISKVGQQQRPRK